MWNFFQRLEIMNYITYYTCQWETGNVKLKYRFGILHFIRFHDVANPANGSCLRIFKRFHWDRELEIKDFGCLLRKSKKWILEFKETTE